MPTALDRGLYLLELLAKRGELSFGQLAEALGGMSRASLSRLLKSLIASGHVHKNPQSGHYGCGHRLAVFVAVKTPERGEHLIARYGQLQDELSEKYDLTVILLERVLLTLINIRKVQTLSSPFMQEVGRINEEPSQPWLRLLAAFTPEAKPLLDDAADRAAAEEIARQGYVFDDQTLRANFRRVGFPLFDEAGQIIGALGLGGSVLQITDAGLPDLVADITPRVAAACRQPLRR